MEFLNRCSHAVNAFLETVIQDWIQSRTVSGIADPVLYSLLAGGKRIRPFLVILSSGIDPLSMLKEGSLEKRVFHAAASIEMIHTYSLIHDDLPAMDDDDLRRGRPSCHRKFSEWEAILAGDALNTLAFENLLQADDSTNPYILKRLILLLSRAAGTGGMICGQAMDLAAEKNPEIWKNDIKQAGGLLEKIHLNKTAAMIRASCEMGAVISNNSNSGKYAQYGEKAGLLFQIADDILDVQGDKKETGKTTGKDQVSGKLTYVTLYGMDRARKMAEQMVEELQVISEELESTGPYGIDYRKVFFELPEYILKRNK